MSLTPFKSALRSRNGQKSRNYSKVFYERLFFILTVSNLLKLRVNPSEGPQFIYATVTVKPAIGSYILLYLACA